MDIAIIGGGPVGCYCAYLLAKSGHNVSVYEEHKKIGSPVQCTGLLTSDFDQFAIPLNKFLINTFSEIEINSPHVNAIIKQKEYLVCRKKFDNYLAKMASSEGANILLGHSFVRKEGKYLVIKNVKDDSKFKIKPDIVIAADGPMSRTANSFGFFHYQRKNLFGVQATVEGNFNKNKYQAFFGNEYSSGMFSWIVPESSTVARVGLVAKKEAKKYFDLLIMEHGFKILEMQAGLIPLYHPKQKLKQDNCYLLGDAAGFVKATSFGGIIPGMKQAQILTNCINFRKDYVVETKKLRKRLWLHLKVRKVMDKLTVDEWDKLIMVAKSGSVRSVLESHTRENLLPIVLKTLLKEPKLMFLARYLI